MRNFIKEEDQCEESLAFPVHNVSVCFYYILYNGVQSPKIHKQIIFIICMFCFVFLVGLETGVIRFEDLVGAKIPLLTF